MFPSSPALCRSVILFAKTRVDAILVWTLDRVVRAAAPAFLRAALGRWPDREETAVFRAAHSAGGHLPRLLHALSAIEGARRLLTAATLDAWLPGGAEHSTMGLTLVTRPRAAFMHLEKTGGTSVQVALSQQYHPIQVLAQPPEGLTATQTMMANSQARSRSLIYGHYGLPFLRLFDPGRAVFTVLREPRARILSVYYYWRSAAVGTAGTEQNLAAVEAARLPLLEFLCSSTVEVRNAVDNLYARRLTGRTADAATDRLRDDPNAALAEALEALATLHTVGITEQMDESLRLLAGRLHLIPPATAPRTNVADDNARALPRAFRPVAREPVTPAVEAELDRLTQLDGVLYTAARRRFDADLLAAEAAAVMPYRDIPH